MIVPSLLQYVNGYRYNPKVATQFDYSLTTILDSSLEGKLIVNEHQDFYRILEESTNLTVGETYETGENVAYLGKPEKTPKDYKLSRIITSPMRENSDIIYLYTYSEEKGE